MKITGIMGSPRSRETTDTLVSAILSAAEQGNPDSEVVIHRLGELNINGCVACMECRKAGKCVQDDDMQSIYEDIMDSDGLVLGTPIYFSTMTSQMKAFTDRLFAFSTADFKTLLKGGRRAVLAITQGAPTPDTFEEQIKNIARVWGWVGINVENTIIAAGVETGNDITGNKELMKQIDEAGKALSELR